MREILCLCIRLKIEDMLIFPPFSTPPFFPTCIQRRRANRSKREEERGGIAFPGDECPTYIVERWGHVKGWILWSTIEYSPRRWLGVSFLCIASVIVHTLGIHNWNDSKHTPHVTRPVKNRACSHVFSAMPTNSFDYLIVVLFSHTEESRNRGRLEMWSNGSSWSTWLKRTVSKVLVRQFFPCLYILQNTTQIFILSR